MKNTNSCLTGTGNSSYRNSTLAQNSLLGVTYKRENQNDTTDSPNSPILVDRNAVIKRSNNTDFTQYRSLSDGRERNAVTADTRVNAVLISGLVPSRQKQSYGGLHNFPRFIQNWGINESKKNLYIAGAFFQLNFSTYATAPFDLEAWEPGQTPGTAENLDYYEPPNRRWGYDIGLQYTPPSPIASRFINLGSPRNEFYEQRSADDPYIKQLRCATTSTGRRVDPHISAAQCT